MSNSLRDQLLKAGLVTESQVKQADKVTKKAGRKARHQQKRSAKPPKTQIQQDIDQAQAAKAERDRKLNREQEIVKAKKAAKAQVSDLIKRHRQNAASADIRYYFQRGNHVKQVNVTTEQRADLLGRRLAVVTFQGGQHLVAMEIADKIGKIDPDAKIHRHEAKTQEADPNDPYAEFEVPDDLMW
jgi:uncharacterized protein YaiL (DUF2058 family)